VSCLHLGAVSALRGFQIWIVPACRGHRCNAIQPASDDKLVPPLNRRTCWRPARAPAHAEARLRHPVAQPLDCLRVLADRRRHLAPVLVGDALLEQRLGTPLVPLPDPLEGGQRVARAA
jgi:hypothetical protein